MTRLRWHAGASNLPGVLRLAVSAFVAHELRALRRVLVLDERRGVGSRMLPRGAAQPASAEASASARNAATASKRA